mgnify:CR=1 FL=1
MSHVKQTPDPTATAQRPYSSTDPFSVRPQPSLEEIQETVYAIQSKQEEHDDALSEIQDALEETNRLIEEYTYTSNRYPSAVPSDDE